MFALLTGARFAPLFWTQFLSAFNDNFLKNSLVFLIMFKLAGAGAQSLVTLAGALFILPFFLLSGLGGEMADRFDKAKLAQRLKLAEIFAAALAVAGFAQQSIPLLFAALGLFGCISALFGPIKYGILPDHLQKSELPTGNALIEGATFVAILLGHARRRFCLRATAAIPPHFAVAMIGIAAACYLASLFIPKTGEAAPDLKIETNIFRSTSHLIADLWADSRLWRAGVMVSLFWMFGAIALSLLPPLVKMQLGGDEMAVSYYLAAFAIAVALGSGLGAFLCAGRIVLLPAPVATVFMGFLLDLNWRCALNGAAVCRRGFLQPSARRGGSASICSASPSPAARWRCRAFPPRRPGPTPTGAPGSSPPSTCSTPPSWWRARWWSRACRRRVLVSPLCSR